MRYRNQILVVIVDVGVLHIQDAAVIVDDLPLSLEVEPHIPLGVEPLAYCTLLSRVYWNMMVVVLGNHMDSRHPDTLMLVVVMLMDNYMVMVMMNTLAEHHKLLVVRHIVAEAPNNLEPNWVYTPGVVDTTVLVEDIAAVVLVVDIDLVLAAVDTGVVDYMSHHLGQVDLDMQVVVNHMQVGHTRVAVTQLQAEHHHMMEHNLQVVLHLNQQMDMLLMVELLVHHQVVS